MDYIAHNETFRYWRVRVESNNPDATILLLCKAKTEQGAIRSAKRYADGKNAIYKERGWTYDGDPQTMEVKGIAYECDPWGREIKGS